MEVATRHEGADIALNLTGGTKLMALAAQSVVAVAQSKRGHAARLRDPRLVAGLLIVGGIGLAALLASQLAPYDPHTFPARPLASPSARHLLGANDTGQDLFSQLLYGARVSLSVGLLVGAISTLIAWTAGLLSGINRAVDTVVRFAIDLILVLPALPLLILIAAYVGAGTRTLIVTLCAISWGAFARIIRGQTQAELRKPYVESARALGASATRVVFRHIAPATTPIALVKFVTTVQYAIVVQASLAFLGLGSATAISWGGMVHRAAQSPVIFLSKAWFWWLLPPALAIALLVVGCALIGWSLERRGAAPGRR